MKFAGAAFAVVGAIAASTVTSRGAFVMGFFVLFFGAIAAGLVLLSAGQWNADDPEPIDVSNPDPFIDEHGVVHHPGDVFDLENHPTPGAHGRV